MRVVHPLCTASASKVEIQHILANHVRQLTIGSSESGEQESRKAGSLVPTSQAFSSSSSSSSFESGGGSI